VKLVRSEASTQYSIFVYANVYRVSFATVCTINVSRSLSRFNS
jgi:hypothetical protein